MREWTMSSKTFEKDWKYIVDTIHLINSSSELEGV